MSFIPALQNIQSGNADDPSRDMSNWNSIVAVVNGGLDYTNLAVNAGILASQTVLGTYTPWTTWTPTLSTSGTSWTSTTINVARYCQIGKVVFFQVSAVGTSNNCTDLTFTLPISALQSTAQYIGGGCTVLNSPGTLLAGLWANLSATVIQVKQYAGATFANGAGTQLVVSGSYEVA